MMTGQIPGGVAPAEPVKYQILIMFLVAGGTGLGAIAAVLGEVCHGAGSSELTKSGFLLWPALFAISLRFPDPSALRIRKRPF